MGCRGDAYTDALVSAAIKLYIQLRRATNKDLVGEEGTVHLYSGSGSTASAKVKKYTTEEEGDIQDTVGQGVNMEELERVVDSMFERCYADKEYIHALGVALESHHVMKFQQVLQHSATEERVEVHKESLNYALYACVNLVTSKKFRLQALEVVATEYEKLQKRDIDWGMLCRIHQLLNRPEQVANTISKILDDLEEVDGDLMGYQLCFDLVDSGDMGFVNRVASALPIKKETEENGQETPRSKEVWTRFDKAHRVLTGGFSGELALSFLHKQSDSDPLIMENLKKALDEKGGRNSMLHNCAVMSHAYLNAGTTNDGFLREHLDWMKKASNW